MQKKQKTSKILIFFIFIIILITLYLIIKTSYVLNYEGVSFEKIFDNLDKIFVFSPFKITFNYCALAWLFFPLLVFALYLTESLKPKADKKWRNIEHGSNDWQTKDEIEDFLNKCSDPIVEFKQEEIDNLFINLEK